MSLKDKFLPTKGEAIASFSAIMISISLLIARDKALSQLEALRHQPLQATSQNQLYALINSQAAERQSLDTFANYIFPLAFAFSATTPIALGFAHISTKTQLT